MAAERDMQACTDVVRDHGRTSRETAEAQLQAEQSANRLRLAVIDATLAEQAAAGSKRDLAAANAKARDGSTAAMASNTVPG